jgi:Protein of unknown function (DUF3500)
MPQHAARRAIARVLIAPSLAALLLAVAYAKAPASATMASTAKSFLDALQPEQRAKATFTLEDEERSNWFYTPVPRKGLQLKEMTDSQRKLAMALLNAGLSQQGYTKATTIISLENVLKAIENGGVVRDPELYYFSVFGTPSESGVWGFRIEGHHISQNFTIARGKVVGAPSFFGANPAEVREGDRKGLRALAHEEDLARDVLQALTPDQRKTAIVETSAPRDILTTNSRIAALKGQASGIQASALNPAQRQKLQALLDEYINNMVDDVAAARRDQVKKAGDNLWFAWSGGVDRGQPHYYRVQTATFLIEYDDTQNNANHIHSVWRDLNGDFGRDLLAAHYQAAHVGTLAQR